MANKDFEKVGFSRERKYLNLIISFLEYLLNLRGKTIKIEADEEISPKVDEIKTREVLEKLYILNIILFISDLTKNESLISLINDELRFNFSFLEQRNIEEATKIFKYISEKENKYYIIFSISIHDKKKNKIELETTLKRENSDIIIISDYRYHYSYSNQKEKLNLLDFIFKKALNVLFNDEGISYSLEEYIKVIKERLEDLNNLKREIEEFLAKNVLKKVSEEYEKKANDYIALPVWRGKSFNFQKWLIFFLMSLIFIVTPLVLIPALLDGKTWHDILVKASIGFIPIIVGFYLLRYSLKLRDLQEEYKFKSIMLSSLPALSLLIDDKNERDKIITTILLEASNLQTLIKDKGEIVKEILPIIELTNKLRNSSTT